MHELQKEKYVTIELSLGSSMNENMGVGHALARGNLNDDMLETFFSPPMFNSISPEIVWP